MAAPLTPSQIAIVKATAPVLKEHGVKITSLFYKNMLDANPDLRNIFNEANQVGGAQPRALAGAVFAYATYVDDLAKLGDAVERIAHKHVSLNIRPEHYPIVGKFLLEAVALVLGDACTHEIAEAVSVNPRVFLPSKEAKRD
jgi:nitric oxide dioxygenase